MPCLNSQLRIFQNYILYIRNKHSLQLKHISLIKISDIFMYEKKTKIKSFFFDSHLGCHIVSLINCSQTISSHFEPFYTWNYLNLMQ